MKFGTGFLLGVLVCAGVYGYLHGVPGSPPEAGDGARSGGPTIELPGGSVRFDAAQRTNVPVPGTDGAWTLHVGDITHGQVAVTLREHHGAAILATTSLREGGDLRFHAGERAFRLTLVKLHAKLLGEDRATFEIGAGPSQTERIEALLRAIEHARGLTFVRNGQAHDATQAASHLRRKWDATKDRIRTAEQFIEQLATKSSLSGDPYEIRRKDGTTVPAADWFRARLAEIDARRPGE